MRASARGELRDGNAEAPRPLRQLIKVAPFTVAALIGVLALSATINVASLVLGLGPHPVVVRLPPRWAARAAATIAQPPENPPQTFQQLTPELAELANARIPISAAPNPPAPPFKLAAVDPISRAKALTCLTSAIYYEAANQTTAGQAAVAQVVLNRLRNPHFPKSICGVVFEGSELATGCQFTFTCDGSLNRQPSLPLWRSAEEVAERSLDGYVAKDVGLATHYHTMWVVPYWQPSVLKVRQIGPHIFYRMNGAVGLASAFAAPYSGSETLPPQLARLQALMAIGPQASLDDPVNVQSVVAKSSRSSPREVASVALARPSEASPSLAQPAIALDPSFFGRESAERQRLPVAGGH